MRQKYWLIIAVSIILTVVFFTSGSVSAQGLFKNSFILNTPQPETGLASNSINDIVLNDFTIWLGTGRGLSKTQDEGLLFESYGREQGIGRGGVSAIAVNDDIIWVATGFDSLVGENRLQTGGGLAYSQNQGGDWTFVPQPGETPISNITFDIALRGNEVWITSFGGGLRKLTNLGENWDIVPPDSFIFSPGARLNHRAFSTINVGGTLWVGTAGGINRSTDGGKTWTNFSHDSTSASSTISGNFVVCLANQSWQGVETIWAGTRSTEIESKDATEFLAVSFSSDQGFTWKTTLQGENVHNIACDDSVVYAASDNGLFKSNDFGESWFLFPAMANTTRDKRVLNNKVFDATATAAHKLWVATADGLATTADNGVTWQIFQVFPQPGRDDEPRTYAYPNPFSPNVHNTLDGTGHVRFAYNTKNDTRLTIKIYNFAMEYVVTVVENAPRPGQNNLYETWDGRSARGEQVHNGIYFYRLELEGDGAFWGKLIVLK